MLTGDITSAVEMHSAFYSLWKRYGYLPESFNVKQGFTMDISPVPITIGEAQNSFFVAGHPPRHLYRGYPLRPEFIESTLMLYHATRDPFYLQVGEQILRGLQRTKTSCGFAAVAGAHHASLPET